ncbi:cation:proton antiporter domain-containing protein [Puia dinghuensis]|uniref:Cation/H+ exchanger transmembrane domain-containing protein n=1 Tax=Puia dinghuensis TaxID=1792502 RepID=A0A8J2XMU5_9BACT|nr:cation:proton antiporter [Puia dinghuensis]GGA81158.1 hypothetical protein GCM10011511_00160 [Puia dinghuensis]
MHDLYVYSSFLLSITIILIFTQLFGYLSVMLKQPRVIGEIFAGIFLGPTIVGYFFPTLSASIFQDTVRSHFFVLSNMALALYMFIIGLEIDFSIADKKTIKHAGILSLITTAIPFMLGVLFAIFSFSFLKGEHTHRFEFCIFVGATLSVTAFPVLARILEENDLLGTKLGTLALLSASMQDVLSWVFLSYATAMASGIDTGENFQKIIRIVLFTGGNIFIVRPVLRVLIRNGDSNNPGQLQKYLSLTLIFLFLNEFIADRLGLQATLGGFLSGLVLPRNKHLVEFIIIRIKDFLQVLLLPLFFALAGLNANMLVFDKLNFLIPAVILLLFAFTGKYIPTLFTMKALGYSFRESSAVGGLNNARGLMELVIAATGLTYGIISQELYSMLVLMAALTTLLAMPIYSLSKLSPPAIVHG